MKVNERRFNTLFKTFITPIMIYIKKYLLLHKNSAVKKLWENALPYNFVNYVDNDSSIANRYQSKEY